MANPLTQVDRDGHRSRPAACLHFFPIEPERRRLHSV